MYPCHWYLFLLILHNCLPLLTVHSSETCCIPIHWYLHSTSNRCLPLPSAHFQAQHRLSRSFQMHMPLQPYQAYRFFLHNGVTIIPNAHAIATAFFMLFTFIFFLLFSKNMGREQPNAKMSLINFPSLIFVKTKILFVHKHILVCFLLFYSFYSA